MAWLSRNSLQIKVCGSMGWWWDAVTAVSGRTKNKSQRRIHTLCCRMTPLDLQDRQDTAVCPAMQRSCQYRIAPRLIRSLLNTIPARVSHTSFSLRNCPPTLPCPCSSFRLRHHYPLLPLRPTLRHHGRLLHATRTMAFASATKTSASTSAPCPSPPLPSSRLLPSSQPSAQYDHNPDAQGRIRQKQSAHPKQVLGLGCIGEGTGVGVSNTTTHRLAALLLAGHRGRGRGRGRGNVVCLVSCGCHGCYRGWL